jgi:large subunit ribosomal protein L30
MSTRLKRKAEPKAARKAAPKRRAARRRAPPTRKPVEKVAELPAVKKEVAPEKTFILAVRLMGPFGTPTHIEKTLTSLRLNRKFNAVLLENNPSALGMLRQAKDHVTWGDVKAADIAALLRERGELLGGLPVTDKSVQETFGEQSIGELASALTQGRIALETLREKGLKSVFRLHPPSGAFGYSIKRPYRSRGELGYRGPEISSLVARMI